jgi:hypothetical protein
MRERGKELIPFPFLFPKPGFAKQFQIDFEFFCTLSKNQSSQKKNIISLCFHEHKNTKLNHFIPFEKFANFGVLQFYPP